MNLSREFRRKGKVSCNIFHVDPLTLLNKGDERVSFVYNKFNEISESPKEVVADF